MIKHLLFIATAVAMSGGTAMAQVRSVAIDDYVLAGGISFEPIPPSSRFQVEKEGGKYIVVVKYWNEWQQKMVTGSVVALDANNQFQPDGMLWKFTLTPDGFLTWEKVN